MPADRQRRESLLDRVAGRRGVGSPVLANGDELAGLVDGLGEDACSWRPTSGRCRSVDRAAAVVFNPALRRSAAARGLRAWVGLADGSRLLAAKLAARARSEDREDHARGRTEPGRRPPRTWSSCSRSAAGQCIFPISSRPTIATCPSSISPWPFHADRNVTGGRLRSGGRLYLKGLGMHSSARLSYALDEPYARFQAELGIDDATAGAGACGSRVFVDGRQKFTSETIRGGMTPVPVTVDLAGASVSTWSSISPTAPTNSTTPIGSTRG